MSSPFGLWTGSVAFSCCFLPVHGLLSTLILGSPPLLFSYLHGVLLVLGVYFTFIAASPTRSRSAGAARDRVHSLCLLGHGWGSAVWTLGLGSSGSGCSSLPGAGFLYYCLFALWDPGGGGVLELFPCMHSMAGINPSVANETGSSVGALLYTLSCPESVGVGLVTVKPATPFNALCRYIYIHICSHAFYITTGFTTSIFNKPLDSSLFVSFIEESSLCSSVAAGPSRWASTPPWWSSLTSPPSCPRWWARTF
jgi:hypothetical protein